MQVTDKVTDFAGRAMHETTVAGKALTAAFYGIAPKLAYMLECGGGSAAALHEVQKYPADYDGVVVGGHAAHLTRQIFGQLWLWQAAHPKAVSHAAGGDADAHSPRGPEQVRPARRGEGRTAGESHRAAPSSRRESRAARALRPIA